MTRTWNTLLITSITDYKAMDYAKSFGFETRVLRRDMNGRAAEATIQLNTTEEEFTQVIEWGQP